MVYAFTISDGVQVRVDDEDRDLEHYPAPRRWYFTMVGVVKRGYIRKMVVSSLEREGKRQNVQLNRIIVERMLGRPLEKREFVHHRDFDPLNLTRANLFASRRRFLLLEDKTIKQFQGCFLDKQTGKWVAQIYAYGKSLPLGYFKCREEATQAFEDAFQRLYPGEMSFDEFLAQFDQEKVTAYLEKDEPEPDRILYVPLQKFCDAHDLNAQNMHIWFERRKLPLKTWRGKVYILQRDALAYQNSHHVYLEVLKQKKRAKQEREERGTFKQQMAARGYVPINQAAKRIGMTRQAIHLRYQAGQFPGERIGRCVYVRFTDVEDSLFEHPTNFLRNEHLSKSKIEFNQEKRERKTN